MNKWRCHSQIIILLCCLVALCFCHSGHAKAKDKPKNKELIVYNWSEFIPQSVLDDFSKETGIKVIYSTFESNEAMFAKIKLLRGKSYDIVFPSGYFVNKMAEQGLLAQLDHSLLPNMRHLDPQMLGLEFDKKNSHSLPYMWGVTGLAYNNKYIAPGNLKSWNDLLQPELKGHLILTDDLRDAFGIGLLACGHSVNAVAVENISDAFQFLKRLKPSVRVFDVTAIKQALIGEEVWAGPIWNGDFLISKEENPHLEYIIPEEGLIGWVDNFVILKESKNKENAYLFINYLLRPEIAARCVEEYKYSTPNLTAITLLPESLRTDPILVPNKETMKKVQFPTDIGSALAVYEKFWEELKTSR